MTARTKKANNPKTLAQYILSDKKQVGAMKERARLISSNFCFGSIEDLINQFEMYQRNSKLKYPAKHLMISAAPNENLTEAQKAKLVEMVVEKLQLQDFPFIATEHLDTMKGGNGLSNHWHLHIAVGCTSPITGKNIDHSHDYYKLMAVCREAEIKFGLRQVRDPYDKKIPRHDERKIKMRETILKALQHSNNMDTFIQKMQEYNCKIIKGRGITFIDEKGMRVKGSDLQIGFSLSKLNKIFDAKSGITEGEEKGTLQSTTKENISDDSLPKNNEYGSNMVESILDIFSPYTKDITEINIEATPKKSATEDDDEDEWKRRKRKR